MSKYNKLWQYISANKKDKYILSYDEIESILGFSIDHSFLTYKKELINYGYEVSKISIKNKQVIIERKGKNNDFKASMKTAIKNVERAIASKDKEVAKENLAIAIKRIDKAASAGVITANYVARTKSRLTLTVNNME